MNDIIKLILSLSLSGSLLALALFALKPLVRHRLSKAVQYYLWLIVLLRLLIPFSFDSSIMNQVFYQPPATGTVNTVKPLEENNTHSSGSTLPTTVEQKQTAGYYNGDTDHQRYLQDVLNQQALNGWLLGAAVVLGFQLVSYGMFLRKIKRTSRPAPMEYYQILKELQGRRSKVQLNVNPLAATPMLIGIWHPVILIPDVSFSENQLRNILSHELTHLKRFDIVIKWITMVAVALHWFNPLMYIIRKEINKACELSCDEGVIKSLNNHEKQAYGETLISVVSEQKYPVGVLQATMCEEKKSLKERLVAIMKHGRKSKAIVVVSILLLVAIAAAAVYLGAGIGTANAAPPNIYVSSETGKGKIALRGTYSWQYRGQNITADSIHPMEMAYMAGNVIYTQASQQLAVSTQQLNRGRKYAFDFKQLTIYKDGQIVEYDGQQPSYRNGVLYFQAPKGFGEYIYSFDLSFKNKGVSNYNLLIRANSESYDLWTIANYKTPYVGNHIMDLNIAGLLPTPDPYFKQQYMSLQTKEAPYGMTVYYEPLEDKPYVGEWPIVTPSSDIETNARMNALVLFCMIDNVDQVTIALRDSKSNGTLKEEEYQTTFTFQRAGLEQQYGNLKDLGNNLEALHDILKKGYIAYASAELYIWKNPTLTGSDHLYYTLLPKTPDNKKESQVYDLTKATDDVNAIKERLSQNKVTELSVYHSPDFDKATMSAIGDDLVKAIKNGSMSMGYKEIVKD